MHTTAIHLCIHSLGSLHMSLVLSVDDLTTVRKWHLFNQTANEAYLQLEMKQKSPCLKKGSALQKQDQATQKGNR